MSCAYVQLYHQDVLHLYSLTHCCVLQLHVFTSVPQLYFVRFTVSYVFRLLLLLHNCSSGADFCCTGADFQYQLLSTIGQTSFDRQHVVCTLHLVHSSIHLQDTTGGSIRPYTLATSTAHRPMKGFPTTNLGKILQRANNWVKLSVRQLPPTQKYSGSGLGLVTQGCSR